MSRLKKNTGSMAKGAPGVSGYLKPKQQTLQELEQVSDIRAKRIKEMNPVDRVDDEMENKGLTDYLRNIFED